MSSLALGGRDVGDAPAGAGWLARLMAWMPRGQLLDGVAWEKRHQAIVVILWMHVVGLPVFALFREYSLSHALFEGAPLLVAAVLASWAPGRRIRVIAATTGLLTSSAVMVHLSGGVIEAHFHFFVMIPLVALYQDWIPFLLSILYVLVHHGVLGGLVPATVFNHEAAVNNSWRWAAIHALFVSAASAVCLVTWRMNERARFDAEQASQRLAVLAVENKRLYDRERGVAETLQRSLLPDALPTLPGLIAAARYSPGGPDAEVGGDWYDVFELIDDKVAIAMGDVVGRGIPAAALMGQLRNGLRAYAAERYQPAEVLGRLHRLVHQHDPDHLATLVYGELDLTTGRLRLACAGHPPPLVRRPDGSAVVLDCLPGVPLGAIAHARYAESVHDLQPGSTVILYTDGLVEDRETPLERGIDVLRLGLADGPADLEELCDHLLAMGTAGRAVDDDIAVLAIGFTELSDSLLIELPSDPRNLATVRSAMRRWLGQWGASEAETYEILVAVGEACSNAIEHGSGPGAGSFVLGAGRRDDKVVIVVRDQGTWRLQRPGPGGRGLDVMRSFMDLEVVKTPNGSEVRLQRRLASLSPTGADR